MELGMSVRPSYILLARAVAADLKKERSDNSSMLYLYDSWSWNVDIEVTL